MEKIDFLKEALTNKKFVYSNIGDYGISLDFYKTKVIIWETIQDTLYLKVIDKNNNNTLYKRTYKGINTLIKYGIKENKHIQ